MQTKQVHPESEERARTRRTGPQKILLVGGILSLTSYLLQRFPAWHADYWFASTCHEACDLLKQQSFDLVLSEFRLTDGWASQMIPHLEGSPANLFCLQIVEAGCWWVPLARTGRKCDMAPALRRSEFFQVLREQIEISEDLRGDG
jgi:hypothetical protein